MERRRRWTNSAQPQTLMIAVFLLYLNAGFTLFYVLIGQISVHPLPLGLAAAQIAAGWGIANEKKWAYWLGVASATFPFALNFWFFGNPLAGMDVLGLMFQIALVALLLHPHSRDYQRIWFK